jgi:hypothetical protein
MSSASELGISIAAPTAWTTRAATSIVNDGASPHAADATVKRSDPTGTFVGDRNDRPVAQQD